MNLVTIHAYSLYIYIYTPYEQVDVLMLMMMLTLTSTKATAASLSKYILYSAHHNFSVCNLMFAIKNSCLDSLA